MPKKTRTTDEHLRTIELMLGGILLGQESKPEVKKLAKLIGVSDKTLSDLFPQEERARNGSRKKQTSE